METAHDLHIKRFEGVASGLDKVDACMDAVVNDIHAVDFILGVKVRVKSLLDVLNNRAPRCIIVDEVAKARSVNDGQT